MAKKTDNQKLIIAGLLGFVAWQVLKKPAATTTTPPTSYTQYQQPPPKNTPAWTAWAQGIINTFGVVANLWAPGGPFYKQNITPEQAVEIGSGQQYANVAGLTKKMAI